MKDNGIKKLGFGMMRLPRIEGIPNDGDKSPIDIEQTKEMVNLFMAAGFTYFDTAWAYDWSEDATRQALVERYPRESFQLATKCAAWIDCKTREDAIAQFTSSLDLTKAGYFDYYLIHNLGSVRTEIFERFDLFNYFKEQKEKGLIKNLGFSFHGSPDELREILKNHTDMDFIQLQINYVDWDDNRVQSEECYKIAMEHGLPIIVMEPVKGGMLSKPPESVAKVFKDADPAASCASWAIKFAADLEGVMVVLSGMSNVEQMKDNISYMKDFTKLSAEEKAVIEKAREELRKIPTIPCTSCNYCTKVCPQNIGIPESFNAMNIYTLYGDKKFAQNRINYDVKVPGKATADECIKCGLCEEACPQNIEIRDELDKIAEAL